MRGFPSEKALVTAYWRKLARSVGAAYKNRDHEGRDALQRPVGTARRPRQLRPSAHAHSNS
jgi:hypothetical protein